MKTGLLFDFFPLRALGCDRAAGNCRRAADADHPPRRLFQRRRASGFRPRPAGLLRDALRRVVEAYPDDPDASALYAEAALYVTVGDLSENREDWTAARRAAYLKPLPRCFPTHPASQGFQDTSACCTFTFTRRKLRISRMRRSPLRRNSPPLSSRPKIHTSATCRATRFLTWACIRKPSMSASDLCPEGGNSYKHIGINGFFPYGVSVSIAP
jgi:hypothetical protein